MTQRAADHWTIRGDPGLSMRFWGDQCVVYHPASNDTLRLPAWVGRTLAWLAANGEWRLGGELPSVDVDEEEFESMLRELTLRDWLVQRHD